MSTAQSNVTPMVKNSTLETVTLKNIVALDLVEQNEAVLSAFQLLDDTSRRISLPLQRTNEQLAKKVEQKKRELQEAKDELALFKSLHTRAEDGSVIDTLASDFLRDEISTDDVDALVNNFTQENNLRVVEKTRDETHRFVDGGKLREMVVQEETATLEKLEEDEKSEVKDIDGDVQVEDK